MTGLSHDIRFAIRSFRKTPGFAAVAILTLALGIGANTAMFGIVDRALLKPFPFARPEQLVQVIETWNGDRGYGPPSWPDFLDWRRDLRSFDGLAGYLNGEGTLQRQGEPERVRLVKATANLFDVLGVKPALGRGFHPGEDEAGKPCAAVLSDSVWRSRFSSDAGIVGASVRLNDAACTVVGVAPPRLEFPIGLSDGIWTTLRPEGTIFADRSSHFVATIARVKSGVSVVAASAEIDGIMRRIARSFPEANRNRSGRVVPLRVWTSTDYRAKLLILSAAVAVVLLIACVNLASMLLARSTARRRELAIRAALGAARSRLVLQMLVESALLALSGAAAGLLVSAAGLKLLSRSIEPYLPGASSVAVDGRMLLFGAAAAGATVLLFGLLPALRAARAEASTLRGEMAGSPRGLDRLRGALVSAETALSLVLLFAAILLIRTLSALQRQDAGFPTDHLMTFKTAPSARAERGQSMETSFYAPLRRRLASIPGVRAVGMINRLPLEAWGISGTFLLEGRPAPPDPNEWYAELRVVSPGYFTAVQADLRRGRDLSEGDSAEAPLVAIVNENFSRKFLGGESPVGQRFRMDAGHPLLTIVGEYRSIRQRGLGQDSEPEIDFPSTQVLPGSELYDFGLGSTMTLVVRSPLPPASLVPAIRQSVREVDPAQPAFALRTMDEVRDRSMGGDRFALALIGTFAGIALVLCLAGIQGVMGYFVAQRRREIAIRMALGATRANILGLVLRAALNLASIGIVVGLAGSIVGGGVLKSLLFGVGPSDPATLAACAIALLATAAGAAAFPARRAARVDPLTALRYE